MSIITTLIFVQQFLTRYLLSTILILGNVGNLIAIAVFFQKRNRTNSCSIYMMATAIVGIISANWAIAPLVYGLDNFSMVDSSLILCRIRGYIIHVSTMCFRYILILMCADRYASCHSRPSIRALCRPQIAYRSVGVLVLFWMIVSVHLLIWESIENNICGVYGLYGQILGFYSLVFTSIVPILCMIVFSIKVMNNLRQVRSRIQTSDGGGRLNQRDIKLIKLCLVEALVFIVCTFAFPVMTIYRTLTASLVPNKSPERLRIESFMNFIAQSLLLYLNYNILFYVHILTSKTYRMEVKQLILKVLRRKRENGANQGIALQMLNQTGTAQRAQTTSAL